MDLREIKGNITSQPNNGDWGHFVGWKSEWFGKLVQLKALFGLWVYSQEGVIKILIQANGQ